MVEKHSSTGGINEAPAKRQRVSRACDQCRATREKCDGSYPSCHACVTSRRTCSYTTPTKKRGIQPGYMRTLELTLAWIFENVAGSEATLRVSLSQEATASLLSGKDAEGSSALHKRWRKSASSRTIERILGPNRTGPLTSDIESEPENSAKDQNLSAFYSRPRPSLHPPSTTKLPSNLWRLFDIYFAYTHTWFPIVEKQDILKLTYTYPKEGVGLPSAKSPEYAELWAILAVASTQGQSMTFGSDLAPEQIPNNRQASQKMYNNARSLIPDECEISSISHVKALLLLVLLNIGLKRWTAAWLLLGRAISNAIDLGLHTATPQAELKRGKHTILACLFLEHLLCSYLGRPGRMSSIEIDSIGLLEEEGLEEWHPWAGVDDSTQAKDPHAFVSRTPNRSLKIFNQLVMLSARLHDTSSSNYFIPDDLHWSESRANTPQHLHLQILHACTSSTTFWAIPLFSNFLKYFGAAAMPSIFGIYIALLSKQGAPNLDENATAFLGDVAFNIARVWSVADGNVPTWSRSGNSPATQSTAAEASGITFPTPAGSNMQGLDRRGDDDLNVFHGSTSNAEFLTGFDMTVATRDISHPDLNNSPLIQDMMSSTLEKYDSRESVNFEALFNELASLDDAENPDYQALFMQNLGLAPNVDLNDAFSSEFGFDPLFSAYMHPGSGTTATDQTQGFTT